MPPAEVQRSGVFDVAIVGGGSAGCVLASRLSENPARRVLLIEAGPDVEPARIPADIRSSNAQSAFNAAYRWPLSASHGSPGARNRPTVNLVHQARVLGGGSSVMGMIALRGVPADYEEWAAAGAAGWDWDGVLPFFRRVERDLDFDDPLHGREGPTAIRRQRPNDWPPLSRAVAAYGERLGWPHVEDMNGDFREGVGSLPMSSLQGLRQSSSICYLDAQVRRRQNLQVMTHSHVVALGRNGMIFNSLDVRTADGSVMRFEAGEIVLCAGALLTPALLMRAGIGDAGELARQGITPLVDRPGVGRHLQNHPLFLLASLMPPRARQHDVEASSLNACLRYASAAGSPTLDLYINPANRSAMHPLGQRIATLQSYLLKPLSRGRVELADAHALSPPRISFNFLSHPSDMQRARRLWLDMCRLATSAELRALGTQFHAVEFSARLRRLNGPGRWNRLASQLAAHAYDWVPGAGAVIRRFMPCGASAEKILRMDEASLLSLSHQFIASSGHHAGTCRMGASTDPFAVVDPQGRVIGVQGLRVADASVMPSLPCGNTNLPTLMVAEKMAALASA